MPRRLYSRTEAERATSREKRRRQWRPNSAVAKFVDYYQLGGATIPEMMLYSELVRRRVPFAYVKYFGDIPFTTAIETSRPDFTLEEYRIIIRVQGAYWHTRPGDAESDAKSAGLWTMMGWTVYDFWEFDIIKDVHGLIDRTIPELYNPTILGGPEPTLGRVSRQLAGLKARNAAAPKVQKATVKEKRRTKPEGSWEPRGRHAFTQLDYVPFRFVGWQTLPDRWPGADQYWKELDDARKARKGEAQSASTDFNSLTATTVDEFQQFPTAYVEEVKLTVPKDEVATYSEMDAVQEELQAEASYGQAA
jgi:hypothetical protein